MIKKLKRSFVIVNMFLISIVLTSIFFFLYISSEKQLDSDKLNGIMGYSKFLDGQTKGPLKPRQMPEFHVFLDEQNQLLEYGGNVNFTNEEVIEIIEIALSKVNDTEVGKISEKKLIYKIDKRKGMTRIIFVDYTDDYNYLLQFTFTLIGVGIGAIIVFLAISLYLSRKVIQPVEEAWRKQQQFISDASHELKTPLTVILANTSMLLNKNDKQSMEEEQWITFIDVEARRMKKLVEDLLFLAKSRETTALAPKTQINVSDLMTECALMFEPIAYEGELTLETDIENDIDLICNHNQIKQLIMILLDNAIKYTPANEKITMSLNTGHDIQIIVHNTGVCLDENILNRLFDRFYKVDKARTRQDNSHGLGLSIAQEIVRNHFGELNVKSDESGTTFVVTFKRKK